MLIGQCGKRWTKKEDNQLKGLVKRLKPHNEAQWSQLAAKFDEERSGEHCKNRWKSVLEKGLVRGNWTEEEDDRLRECMGFGMRLDHEKTFTNFRLSY